MHKAYNTTQKEVFCFDLATATQPQIHWHCANVNKKAYLNLR